MTVYRNAVNS